MARAGARRPVTTVTGTGSTETRPAATPDDAAQVRSVTDTSALDRDAADNTVGHLLVSEHAVTGTAGNGSAPASSVLASLALDGMAQARILRRGADTGRLTHIQRIPARRGRRADWPDWLPAGLSEALAGTGRRGRGPTRPGRRGWPARAAT